MASMETSCADHVGRNPKANVSSRVGQAQPGTQSVQPEPVERLMDTSLR